MYFRYAEPHATNCRSSVDRRVVMIAKASISFDRAIFIWQMADFCSVFWRRHAFLQREVKRNDDSHRDFILTRSLADYP